MVRFLVAVILGFSLLGGCAGPRATNEVPSKLRDRQIIVVFEDRGSERLTAIATEIAERYGVTFTREFPLTSAKVWCAVFVPPPDADFDSILAGIRADPRVADAQENQTFTTALDADVLERLQYAPEQMGIPELHQWTVGEGVTVAVVDTGVDRDHPEFLDSAVTAKSFVEPAVNAGFDTDRHGTAVAGLIAARTDDAAGISGIAPGAEILAVKACWHPDEQVEAARCSSWTIAQAIDHAVKAGADIINLSLAGPPDALIERLLNEAHRRNILMVAAAGDPTNPVQSFPASLANVIGVISTDKRGEVGGSAWAADAELVVAPGEEIITISPGGSYNLRSGSSLASAHVSGVLALLLSAKSGRSPDDVLNEAFATGERKFFRGDSQRFATRLNGPAAYKSLAPIN